MSKKLWIDDIREIPSDFDYWAKTSKEAIDFLSNEPITEVSFDHDLGEDCNGTGYDVAKWIEEASFFSTIPKLIWQIHSANPVGRRNIELAMLNADKFWNKKQNKC